MDVFSRTPGRPILGWDGVEYCNGQEGDWLQDLTYRFAELDQHLYHNRLPIAVRTWLVNALANHTVMAVDDTCEQPYQEAVFKVLVRYPRALEAVEQRLAADMQSNRIMTRNCAGSYVAWFGIRVELARQATGNNARRLCAAGHIDSQQLG